MSSDTLGQPTSEVPPPVKKPPMRIVLVVILIIVIMLGAFVVYWFFLKPQIPWLFVGAYAEYSGETTVSDMQINATMRIEVVEYNATSAKILTYIRMENALLGRFYENQTTAWGDIKTTNYEVEGYNIKSSYEDYVYFQGVGTKYCKIFEYTGYGMNSGINMTIYIDKDVDWPIKVTYEIKVGSTELTLDLLVIETNIPGLKK